MKKQPYRRCKRRVEMCRKESKNNDLRRQSIRKEGQKNARYLRTISPSRYG